MKNITTPATRPKPDIKLLIAEGLYPITHIGGVDLIQLKDVSYIESMGNQSGFRILGKPKPEVTNRPLKLVEEDLAPFLFIRISQSFLINIRHLARYDNGKDGRAVMKDGKELTVSREFKGNLVPYIQF